MTTIHHEIRADCRPERVWAMLADLTAVERYNPGVRAAAIEGRQRTGIGATRSCELVLDTLVMKRKLTSTLDAVFAELVKQAEARA